MLLSHFFTRGAEEEMVGTVSQPVLHLAGDH